MNICQIMCIIVTLLILPVALFIIFLFGFYIRSLTMKGACAKIPATPYIFAHRGFTKLYQENTLESSLEAVKNNYGIEMDLFNLKSGEIVLFHDYNTKELTGVDRNIESTPPTPTINLVLIQK